MKKVIFSALLVIAVLAPLRPIRAQTGNGPVKTAKPSGGNVAAGKEVKNEKLTAANSSLPAAALVSGSAGTSNEAALANIYRVGIGDVLDVRLSKVTANRSTLFTVMEDGLIDFPLAGGMISVAGLTTDEIRELLVLELKRRAIQEGAQITVAVRQYASHTATITGLVATPGPRILRREVVPLYVILAEVQTRFDATRATIMRKNSAPLTVDISDPNSTGVLIHSGDIINISPRPQEFYYIGGRITFPGQKVFQPGITLLQAILAAGGTTRQSDLVELSREGENAHLTTARYSVREIKAGKVADPRLQPGDRLEVTH